MTQKAATCESHASAGLERDIGKPRAEWTADDLVRFALDRGIRLVALMHVGADAFLKTLDFVPRDGAHLRAILNAGERADGSSLFGAMGIPAGASDIVLRPRIQSAFLDPFSPEPTLALLCGHKGRDGAPLPESPDTIVRSAYERARATLGISLEALGEGEYFLGKHAEERDIYGTCDRGYHATCPFVFGEGLRRRAMAMLSDIGVPIKYGHSEVGYVEPDEAENVIWEQHEIELALQPLPEAADAVVLTGWVLRNLAHREGLRCCIDPIVREGHAGSGLHFHMSPVVGTEHRGGIKEEGELHGEARWLIGGLVSGGAALMAFGNRDPRSFVRLSQGKEAPSTVTWGRYNRRALVRLPIVPTDADGAPVAPPTVEFRLADGSAHPHLLLAGIGQLLVAGSAMNDLDAVLARTNVESIGTGGQGATPVPRSFAETAAALESQRKALEAGGVFPRHLVDKVIAELRSL